MNYAVKLYSTEPEEINNFLKEFFNRNFSLENQLEWSKNYENPIELVEIIGSFIDNNDRFKINMWVSIDEGILINVTDNNANDLIKYLYERFPY